MKRALMVLAAAAVVAGPAMADQALATSKNCMACHAVDKKLVGPCLQGGRKPSTAKARRTPYGQAGTRRSSRAAPVSGAPCRCRRMRRSTKPRPKKLAASGC